MSLMDAQEEYERSLYDAACECIFYNNTGGLDEVVVYDIAFDHDVNVADLKQHLKKEHGIEYK